MNDADYLRPQRSEQNPASPGLRREALSAISDGPASVTKPGEYRLQEYGIEEPISVLGAVTRLLPGRGVPIVFLIDENHSICECIKQNVANAHELVKKAQVNLIGVESHRGGIEWDDYDGRYKDTFDMGENLEPVNDCPKFADCMRSSGARVLGVECLGMLSQEQCELATHELWKGRPAKDHPFNQQRSEHFVRTWLELRSRHHLTGNLILNAGGDHISHIASWIKDGTVERRACQNAAYVRVRSPAYQD